MLTALDRIANQNHLQLIKALLPYLPPDRQRPLSICIKMMEMQNLLRFYDHGGCCLNACSAAGESPELSDILTDIRNYCEPGEQEMIDQWFQLMTAMELYSMFAQDEEASADPEENPDFSERMENDE